MERIGFYLKYRICLRGFRESSHDLRRIYYLHQNPSRSLPNFTIDILETTTSRCTLTMSSYSSPQKTETSKKSSSKKVSSRKPFKSNDLAKTTPLSISYPKSPKIKSHNIDRNIWVTTEDSWGAKEDEELGILSKIVPHALLHSSTPSKRSGAEFKAASPAI